MISFKVDHDLFYATLSITHCFVNINGLRASFLQDYEVQSSNPSEFSNRIWHFGHNPFYFFLSLKDQYSFFGGGEISFTWITNSKSVLFCCRFLVLFFFKADHVQCSLPFPSLDEGPDIPITQMLLIAPLITTIILAETGNSDLSTEVIMKMTIIHFAPDVNSESDLGLSICLLLPCHDQNAT